MFRANLSTSLSSCVIRNIQYGLAAFAFLVIAGCGFHLRGTEYADLLVGMESVQVDSQSPYLQFAFTGALRRTGFRVVERDADYVLIILDESTTPDVLTPEAHQAISLQSLVYQVRYRVVYGSGGFAIPETTFESSSLVTRRTDQELVNRVTEDLLLERFRGEAVRAINAHLQRVVASQPVKSNASE